MNPPSKALILIVDAQPERRARLAALLRERYEPRLAGHAAEGLSLAGQLPRPELVLVDAGPDGAAAAALCRQLKADPDTAAIALLALHGPDQHEAERASLAAGAADVVHSPPLAETLLARVAGQLELARARRLLRHQEGLLEHLVEERTRDLAQTLDAVVWAMASLAETRDYETANHIRRVQHYVAALARQLQGRRRFAGELSDDNIALLYKAAPLHDIGKVAIPDAILLKPGRLSDEEFAVMKLHTVYGRDAIAGVERHLGHSNTFLRYAREIAYSHQEKFDGSGYPQGLAGDAIPVAARLMAVADVYDALISKRVYKPAFTHETALELIRQGSGEHFDPDVVDALLTVEEEFMAIAARFADPVH